VAAFVPSLPADPVIAGATIFWHLLLFGQLFFGAPPRRRQPARAWVERADPVVDRSAPAVRHLLAVSVAISVAALGYRIGDRGTAQVICLLTGAAALGFAAPFLVRRLGARSVAAFAIVAVLVAALAAAGDPGVALSLFALAQSCTLAWLWTRTGLFEDLLDLFYRRPAHLVVASFLSLIALGSLFLSFPAASSGGTAVPLLDAVFTATSAACVTGLIVLDTPADFSSFGHAVILVLIQAGGLNIMVLSAFAAGLLGRNLGFRGEGALRDMLALHPGRSVRRLVLFIGLGTLAWESLGAAALSGLYLRQGVETGTAIWYGLFHAVSAFCNAGFSLHSNSMVGFAADPAVLAVIATLITAGGLGFGVLGYAWTRLARRRRDAESLHARTVLLVSLALVVSGAVVYCVVEWNHTLADLSPVDRVANALFQSVTLRTAGFNSVEFERLRPATLFMMLAWMVVGASPGGTGGGIKTTTAAVLIGSVLALLSRRERAVLFRRRISLDTVFRSGAIATAAAVAVAAGAFALLATQGQRFEVLLFEAVSAFGTVGLSLGATPSLDGTGKVIVMCLMFAGRIGPLTLALLVGRASASRVSYPDSRIMVG
ncbi:MAG TPA: potassium transporter TrkG, partial [Candidatus Polarisedimenticolaceae bacterium]|nr:potassium transporter TrkG [Candidatus Polarisedimenticolaceae bacterium]